MTEQQICDELTKLFKAEFDRQYQTTGHLIKTGKLKQSIKWYFQGKGKYSMTSEDYLKYLNIPYHISENVFKSKGFQKIKDLIKELYSERIIDVLLNNKEWKP